MTHQKLKVCVRARAGHSDSDADVPAAAAIRRRVETGTGHRAEHVDQAIVPDTRHERASAQANFVSRTVGQKSVIAAYRQNWSDLNWEESCEICAALERVS